MGEKRSTNRNDERPSLSDPGGSLTAGLRTALENDLAVRYRAALWAANQIDADTRKSFFELAPVIILFPLLPRGYIFSNYPKKPADRWRRCANRHRQ
jgi:hypothetical protein